MKKPIIAPTEAHLLDHFERGEISSDLGKIRTALAAMNSETDAMGLEARNIYVGVEAPFPLVAFPYPQFQMCQN